MASIPMMPFAPPTGRVFAAKRVQQKEDQLLETDPILQKVEENNGGGTISGRKNSVPVVPQKKKGGGFGGLFANN
ncbi:unnamed protein product [Lupinus luteus]|uniref:Uncharacterized protein n=1 Tax=Lupinus luteus TaxID=3873 RepID=A0AAV1WFT8_LUPLU